MHRANRTLIALLFLTSTGVALPSAAVTLEPTARIEASGRVDLDGFGPQPPLSNQFQSEVAPPAFSVSSVNVAASAPGSYSYSAFSDIGLLKLGVTGSLSNGGSSSMNGGELALLNANANVLDQLQLTSSVAGPQPVTMTMAVDGLLTPGSGQILANSTLNFGLIGARGTDTGTYFSGSVDDTLTVTRTIDFASAGSSVTVSFEGELNLAIYRVGGNSTTSGDLGNTARFTLILPASVTIASSESGTFGVPIPVPEPENYALLLAGLAIVGSATRKRRVGQKV